MYYSLVRSDGGDGKLESKGGAVANPGTGDRERPAHCPRGQRAAMQAKSMSLLSCGKTMCEDAREILLRNPDAVIGDDDVRVAFVYGKNGNGNAFIGPFYFIKCLLRVPKEVN